MTDSARIRYRLAAEIRDLLAQSTLDLPPEIIPGCLWQQSLRRFSQLRTARERGWRHCLPRLRQETVRHLYSARLAISEVLDALQKPATALPSPRELAAELESLESEFDEVRFERREITVTTEPIVLDGVSFGAFDISLQLTPERCFDYRVFARGEPHCSASDEQVIHPHVRDGRLCAGDGRAPISAALAAGRLVDFFLIVNNVLRTYNDESAYIRISEWNGLLCCDCGDVTALDECHRCGDCEDPVCDGCAVFCRCDSAVCAGCCEHCAECGDGFCRHCLNRQSLCSDCVSDSSSDSSETDALDSQSPAAVQSDRLGQTAVSA